VKKNAVIHRVFRQEKDDLLSPALGWEVLEVQGLYTAIVLLFLGMGVYYLNTEPVVAVHHFLISLYFFVFLFEIRGKPFSRSVYWLLLLLLVGDAFMQFSIGDMNMISGLVSAMFALSTWQAQRRLS
jgi:hypothetical protein